MLLVLINLEIGLVMQDSKKLHSKGTGGEVKRSYSCNDQHLGTIDEGFKLFNTIMFWIACLVV